MKIDRRNFLKSAALGSIAAYLPLQACTQRKPGSVDPALDKILREPVLNKERFSSPVILEKVELLRYKDNFICRVRTPDGAEGFSVSNNMQMVSLYPIFLNRNTEF